MQDIALKDTPNYLLNLKFQLIFITIFEKYFYLTYFDEYHLKFNPEKLKSSFLKNTNNDNIKDFDSYDI